MTIYTLSTTVQENAPRFLWRNDLLSLFGGVPFELFVDEMTYQTGEIPATTTFTADAPIACNAVGIAGVTWSGQIVSVFYNDGLGWTLAGAWQPIDGAPFLGVFDFQTATNWKLEISNGIVEAAVIKIGMALAMQRNQYSGFSPFTKNLETTPDKQLGAHFTGKQVDRVRRGAKYDYKNLKADWVRALFKPLSIDSALYSIFGAWRADDYRREVVYGWVSEIPKPSNQGTRDYMSVSFSLEGPEK